MVDLKISNEKLRDRARRVVQMGVSSTSVLDVGQVDVLDAVLAQCDGQAKLAILVATLGCTADEGRAKLAAASGSLRDALRVD